MHHRLPLDAVSICLVKGGTHKRPSKIGLIGQPFFKDSIFYSCLNKNI